MKKKIEIRMIPFSLLEPNRGQIEGLPKNPRVIKNAKFEALKVSLKENQEMVPLRELMVYRFKDEGKYVIIGGNMRFRAMQDIGLREAPCKIIPAGTELIKLKAYTIKDNLHYGEWNMNDVANGFDLDELAKCGIDVKKYMTSEQDFGGSNSELDIDSFDEKMNMKMVFSKEDFIWVKERLDAINTNTEMAILKLTGWN